jgi:hypothetical protein
MTLGFDIYNGDLSVTIVWQTLENPIIWLSGLYKVHKYRCMTDSTSTTALTGTSGVTFAQLGTLLELSKFPQVRVGGTD